MSTLDDIREAEALRDAAADLNARANAAVTDAEDALRRAQAERAGAREWLRITRAQLTEATDRRHRELFEERQALIPPDEGRTA